MTPFRHVTIIFLMLLFSEKADSATACSASIKTELNAFSTADLSRFPKAKITWEEGGTFSTEGESVEIQSIDLGRKRTVLLKIEFFGHKRKKRTHRFVVINKNIRHAEDGGEAEYSCGTSLPLRSKEVLDYVIGRLKEKGVGVTGIGD